MPSLKSQFKNTYKRMYTPGASKHTATEEQKQKTIYSTNTRNGYIKSSAAFVDFLKQNNLKAATMEQARKYVPVYLNEQIDKGVSAWTIRTRAAALAKAYGCKSADFGVDLPARRTADITRSRTATEYSKHFSEGAHADLVAFCKSTGLRRNELEKLQNRDITKDDKGNYIINVRGSTAKGGRARSLQVYNQDAEVLRRAFAVIEKAKAATDQTEKVWGKVSKAAPIHSYRAEYAKSLYEKYAREENELQPGEVYACRGAFAGRVYDKAALHIVTQALGHNRLDVAVNNYLNA